jgi:gas vesicle protein
MNDTVVAVVSAFFIIGILVGIVAVIAAAVFRADRRGRQVDPEDLRDYEPEDSWNDTKPDGHRRWPGESDTDFRGR